MQILKKKFSEKNRVLELAIYMPRNKFSHLNIHRVLNDKNIMLLCFYVFNRKIVITYANLKTDITVDLEIHFKKPKRI